MISWDGVTGRSKWNDSQGLIKKFALIAKKYIIVLEKTDLKQTRDGKRIFFHYYIISTLRSKLI